MSLNIFFESKGPFTVKELFNNVNENKLIKDIHSLDKSTSDSITFFDSINYKKEALLTKAKFCITNEKLKFFLPKTCAAIVVKNVLYELARVTKKYYQDADVDYQDFTLKS